MPQGTFSRVVGGLDIVLIDKLPEPILMVVQLGAHANQPGIARARPAQEQAVNRVAHRCHSAAKYAPGDHAGILFAPMFKHRGELLNQIVSQSFHMGCLGVRSTPGCRVAGEPSTIGAGQHASPSWHDRS